MTGTIRILSSSDKHGCVDTCIVIVLEDERFLSLSLCYDIDPIKRGGEGGYLILFRN